MIPIPAIGEIIRDFLQPITLRSYGAGSFEKGRYFPGTVSSIAMDGAVYPASGDEMRLLPEGIRTEAALVIYTESELRTATEPGQNDADSIDYGGKTWEIRISEPWAYGGYWRSIATKRAQSVGYANVYYGIGPDAVLTASQIKGLQGKLFQNTRQSNWTTATGPGPSVHIVYAHPSSMGIAQFWVDNFTGGFTFVGVVDVDGVDYNQYNSVQDNLGVTTVQVR